MKKPFVIVASILGILALAIVVVVILDSNKSAPNTAPVAPADPLNPQGVVQNLQAPPAQQFNVAGDPRIAALINDLGDGDFNRRVAATDALKQMGAAALPQLQAAAQQHPDDDVRLRCKTIIKAIGEAPAIAAQQAANPLAAFGAGNQQGGMGGLLGGLGGAGGAGGGDMMGMLMQMMGGMGGAGGLGGLGGLGGAGGGDMNALLGQLLGGGALGGARPGAAGGDMNALLGQMLGGGGGLGLLGGLGGAGGGDMNALLQQMLGGMGGAAVGNQQGNAVAQVGGLDGILAQLGQLQGAMGGGGGAPIGRPPPPPVADLSINLLDSFGARLGESGDGLRVLELRANTPAAKSGMQTGDVITQINGRAVKSREDIVETLQRAERGKPLKIEITRRGDLMTLSTEF
jgi:hypothetical protein